MSHRCLESFTHSHSFLGNDVFPYCSLSGFQLALKRGFPTVLCPAWEEQLVRYWLPNPSTVLQWHMYLSVCNCRVNTFLPKLCQKMSATILIHLPFTCTLKSQPHTRTTFRQGLYKCRTKSILSPRGYQPVQYLGNY